MTASPPAGASRRCQSGAVSADEDNTEDGDLQDLAAPRGPRRARRQDGALRRLGDAAGVPRAARWPSTGPAATSAVAFDVSHLGTVRVSGPDAFEHLQRSFSNDLEPGPPGRAQYTHLLDEDGFVVDDIIVWWVDEERFDVMPNASNTSDVRRRHRRGRRDRGAGGHRRAGPRGADQRLAERVAGRRRGAPLQRRALRVGRRDLPGGRHGLHRGGRCRVRGPGRRGDRASGRPCWPRASPRPGSAPGTPCASRRACPCTATSSARASRRSRRGWLGRRLGQGTRSPGGPPSRRSGPTARRAACVAWWPKAASRCATGPSSATKMTRSASSPAATSRPCASGGSGWASSRPMPELLDGDSVTVLQRGRELTASLVRPPLWPVREDEE